MYPYISFHGIDISMTGLGLVIAYLTFLINVYFLSQKHKLNFLPFFLSQPLFIILVYLWGRTVTVLIDIITNNATHLSFSLDAVISLFLPVDFKFHYVGILTWLIIYFRLFLSQKASRRNIAVRINIFCTSLYVSLIPLWLFFLMGDNVIGKPTNGILGVYRFTDETDLLKYNMVYPFGLFLSIRSFLVLLIKKFLEKNIRKPQWLINFALFLLGTSFLLLYQKYPRHGVMQIIGITIDLKQYFSRLLVLFLLIVHLIIDNKHISRQ